MVAAAAEIGNGGQGDKGNAGKKNRDDDNAGLVFGQFHCGFSFLEIAALATVFICIIGALSCIEFAAVAALFGGRHIFYVKYFVNFCGCKSSQKMYRIDRI